MNTLPPNRYLAVTPNLCSMSSFLLCFQETMSILFVVVTLLQGIWSLNLNLNPEAIFFIWESPKRLAVSTIFSLISAFLLRSARTVQCFQNLTLCTLSSSSSSTSLLLVVSAEYLRAAITQPGAPSGCQPVSTTDPFALGKTGKTALGKTGKKTLLDQTGEKMYRTKEEKNALCKTGKQSTLDQTGEGMSTTKQERIAKEKTGKHCNRPNRKNCTKQNRQKGVT